MGKHMAFYIPNESQQKYLSIDMQFDSKSGALHIAISQ